MYNCSDTMVAFVAHKTLTAFRLDENLVRGLQAVKERDGILMAEQVRRALVAWLEAKGMPVKADRKRAATRKRS